MYILLAWGTDELTYRAEDLDRIRRWTEKEADWPNLLRIHHAIRPKPKAKPTYHLVVANGRRARLSPGGRPQGHGAWPYRANFRTSWQPADENAAIEVWLTINGATAVCGLRLSDRTMRHRTYKVEHFRASLRPTMAAAIAWLGDLKPKQVVVDPMCGAGTILAEAVLATRGNRLPDGTGWDLTFDRRRYGRRPCPRRPRRTCAAWTRWRVEPWDARQLPLGDGQRRSRFSPILPSASN